MPIQAYRVLGFMTGLKSTNRTTKISRVDTRSKKIVRKFRYMIGAIIVLVGLAWFVVYSFLLHIREERRATQIEKDEERRGEEKRQREWAEYEQRLNACIQEYKTKLKDYEGNIEAFCSYELEKYESNHA